MAIGSLLEKISRRYNWFHYYLKSSEARKRTSLYDMFWHVTGPICEKIAPKYSSNVSEDSEYIYYKINDFDKIFNYPKQVPYHHFAQVITEGMQERHWHHYEVPQTLVNKGDVIVDCGSAEGFFAFKYQDIASKIYAIEPLPIFIKSLHKLFDKNDAVEILPVALSNEKGTLFLEKSNIASTCKSSIDGNEDNYIKIESVTIDSIFAEKGIKIDYLKADLEGFEENMILGALETIKQSKPKIAITTYHRGQDCDKLMNILKSIVPEYKFYAKGIEYTEGRPVMLHAWCD